MQSLVFLPIMAGMAPAGTLSSTGVLSSQSVPQVVVLAQENQLQETKFKPAPVDPVLEAEAEAIDAYFAARNMPLAGLGMKMAIEAENNDLDWRLLPAIAVRESTGGKNDCNNVKNNPFGWASCKVGFKSLDEAVETVALNLGGNNPNTSKHYDNKTTTQILHAYNPPSIVPRYAEQVLAIMKAISVEDMAVILNTPESSSGLSVQTM